jgi:extracellular elastinolytic metalloproteinase
MVRKFFVFLNITGIPPGMKIIAATLGLVLCLLTDQSAFAQDAKIIIQQYFDNRSADWNKEDVRDWKVSNSYFNRNTRAQYVYVQQAHRTIPFYNVISIFLLRDDSILYARPAIIPNVISKIQHHEPSIPPHEAIEHAAGILDYEVNVRPELTDSREDQHTYYYLVTDLSDSPIEVSLVYVLKDEKLRLAWNVSMEMKADHHWWNVRVDALTGAFIERNDYTVSCNFDSDANAHEASANSSAHTMHAGSGTYNVFPFPVEAPTFGSRSLLSDPHDPAASPYGWHDINGSAGHEFTITRGNNVYAYEDANNDNLPGYSPDGTVDLIFDFPYTHYGIPLDNRDASLTNLFYACNRIHDYLHPLGFDEGAGNFQQNNYGNGGLGNDFVKAEGFDGSGTNNANFATPPDGISGRMQMYLWDGDAGLCSDLSITSSTVNGNLTIGTATFSAAGSVTAQLILVNDGSGVTTDACSPIINAIAGKIALIDRGSCNFVNKAQAAEQAGAVGVIIANNVSGSPPDMSGTPVLSIPCVSVSLSDGNALKNALLSGAVTATINTCSVNPIDASFDNGVIIHEYGHGVSNRLTGGPAHSGCLSNGEQAGEGWSDWLASDAHHRDRRCGNGCAGHRHFFQCGSVFRRRNQTFSIFNQSKYQSSYVWRPGTEHRCAFHR